MNMWSHSSFNCLFCCYTFVSSPEFHRKKYNSFSLSSWVIFYQAFIMLGVLSGFSKLFCILLFCFKASCPELAIWFQQVHTDVKQSKIIASLILQRIFPVIYLRTRFDCFARPQQYWFIFCLLTMMIPRCSCSRRLLAIL